MLVWEARQVRREVVAEAAPGRFGAGLTRYCVCIDVHVVGQYSIDVCTVSLVYLHCNSSTGNGVQI